MHRHCGTYYSYPSHSRHPKHQGVDRTKKPIQDLEQLIMDCDNATGALTKAHVLPVHGIINLNDIGWEKQDLFSLMWEVREAVKEVENQCVKGVELNRQITMPN